MSKERITLTVLDSPIIIEYVLNPDVNNDLRYILSDGKLIKGDVSPEMNQFLIDTLWDSVLLRHPTPPKTIGIIELK